MPLSKYEKWFFDHHGWLELKGVVPPAELGPMLRLARRWHDAAPPDFRGGPQPFDGVPAPMQVWRHEEGHPQYVSHVQYGDPSYARLATNPEIMRVVAALQGGAGRSTLIASDMVQMRREGGALNEGPFHGEIGEQVLGGSTVPGEHFKDYHVENGEIFAGFLNCAVSLVDVPLGSGFVCIPGSHKRNFRPPDNVQEGYPEEQVMRGPGVPSISVYDPPP